MISRRRRQLNSFLGSSRERTIFPSDSWEEWSTVKGSNTLLQARHSQYRSYIPGSWYLKEQKRHRGSPNGRGTRQAPQSTYVIVLGWSAKPDIRLLWSAHSIGLTGWAVSSQGNTGIGLRPVIDGSAPADEASSLHSHPRGLGGGPSGSSAAAAKANPI